MKETINNNFRMTIIKRMIAIFVAVIFICGTFFVPSGVYASDEAETENSTEVEQVKEEAELTDQTEQNGQNATVPQTTEPQIDETEADTKMEDLLVMPKNDETEYEGFLYKIEDDTTNKEIKEMENEIDNLDSDQEVEEITKNELYVADSLDTIDSVADTENIQYIEPNYILSATATPNDTYYSSQSWSLDMMMVPEVWDQNIFGNGTTIAVLDTGKPEHEDIDNNIFVNEANFSGSDTIIDSDGHGTGVIGTIAATYNNKKGLAGVMPEAKIMPVKILNDDGDGTTANVVEGINHAIKNKADVINLSLGGSRGTNSLLEACTRATQAGVIVVASAGNEADDEDENGKDNPVQYPAAYDCVVSVASVDKDREHSSFSTYNNKVTVAAPGEHIRSLSKDNEYGYWSGTSFSSPQVAALAAMAKSINPEIITSKFINVLKLTSIDAGKTGYDVYYGYGIVSYANVYNYLTSNNAELRTYLSSSAYTYSGRVKTPTVTVKQGNNVLTKGKDYTISFSKGRTKVGTYNVTASAIISQTDASTVFGKSTATYKINPPLVRSIRSPARGNNMVTARWYSMSKKQKNAYKHQITGFQARVSRHSDFRNAKYGRIKGYYRTSKTIKNLGNKKKYYIQYRTYKTVSGKNYYSKWSSVRTIFTR